MRRILSRFPTSTLMGLAFTIPAMLIAGLLLFYHSLEAREFRPSLPMSAMYTTDLLLPVSSITSCTAWWTTAGA